MTDPKNRTEQERVGAIALKGVYTNVTRAKALLEHAGEMKGTGRAALADDIARGAIALLHASMEDFVKTMVRAVRPNPEPRLLTPINTSGELKKRLQEIGLYEDRNIGRAVDDLGWLMQRRHKIVHEADFANWDGKETVGFSEVDIKSLLHAVSAINFLALCLFVRAMTGTLDQPYEFTAGQDLAAAIEAARVAPGDAFVDRVFEIMGASKAAP